MNILIICSDITPNGGTERAVSNLVGILGDEDNMNVTIISLISKPGDKSYFSIDGAKIYHLNQKPLKSSVLGKLLWYVKVINRLSKFLILNGINPDVILGIGHNINVILPFLKKKKCRIYGCEHIAFNTIPLMFRCILKGVYPFLDGLIVLSLSAKKKVSTYNKKILVIPNSLPFSASHLALLKELRIIMVGRLSQEKGYDRLIPIAESLQGKYVNWHIDIYGDGEQFEMLRNLYIENGVDEFVRLRGSVKNVIKEYLASSILIMTSYTEAFPMVLLEAKSCGLPVVAYECEGTNEIIRNGIDGYIIPNNDFVEFVNKTSELMESYEKRVKMGKQAYVDVLKYRKEFISTQWRKVLTGDDVM